MVSDRSRAIYEIVSSESTENIESFLIALRTREISFESRKIELQRILNGPAETIQRFRKLLEEWPENGAKDESQLADAIDAASFSHQKISQTPRAELVWTGPASGHPTARKTYQVINEMLRHASSKVLIVGYSLFLRGELAQELFSQLGLLSSKGVRVTFIVDRRYKGWGADGDEGHSVREIMNAWNLGTPRPLIYSWKSEDDESSKLHAKLLLVDDRDLLVTSANLTGAGMETNLEMGVRLQGETARNCSEHFAGLQSTGFFDEEVWQ